MKPAASGRRLHHYHEVLQGKPRGEYETAHINREAIDHGRKACLTLSYVSKNKHTYAVICIIILTMALLGLEKPMAGASEQGQSACSDTGQVTFQRIDADRAQADVEELKSALSEAVDVGTEKIDTLMGQEYLLYPEVAEVELADGGRRSAYTLASGHGNYVIAGTRSNKSSSVFEDIDLFRVASTEDGGFSNKEIASTRKNQIGNCRVGTTWHCTRQKDKSCFEKHCSRCTYLLHWKAVVACAIIACPYIANYTCCAAGKCVPRMIGVGADESETE